MGLYRQNILRLILKAFLAGMAPALLCFGQSSPSAQSASKPSTQSAAEPQAASKAPSSPDKVVLTVGETKVTQADMDGLINSLSPQVQQAIASRGRGALGEQYTMMLLLSQKAVGDHLDASPAFQRRINLERAQMLAQEEYRNLEKTLTASPEEVSTYYSAHQGEFEQVKIREIVVRTKPEGAKQEDPGLSSADAKARIDSIQKAVTAGTDPAQITKQFGINNVVMFEDKPRSVRRGELLPALDKIAFELKDNQFSDPIQISQAMVVLQSLGHAQPDVKDVSPEIENTLRQKKLEVTLNDLKAKTKVWMDPDYFKTPASASPSADKPPAGGPAQEEPTQH